jgi:hypothetical protein
VAPISDALAVDTQWLLQELMQPNTFGQLFERVEQRMLYEGVWNARFPFVDIKEAILDLRRYVGEKRKFKTCL